MAAERAGFLKDRFTALDTLALTRELRALSRARVDKVFDLATGGWSISFRVPNVGRRELVLVPGRFAALVEAIEVADGLSPVARELRRLLTGARLTSVTEPGGERYLELEFTAAASDPPLVLAVELFGTGNLLVARGGKILAVQHAKTWSQRTVRIGAEYVRPPSRGDPWKRTGAEIQAALVGSRTDRATTLAARLALGGPVAEEALARASLDGSVPAPLDAEASALAIERSIAAILAAVGESPSGYLYRRGELLLDVEPFPSERLRADGSVTEERFATFSAAAIRYFIELGTPAPSERSPGPAEIASAELQRQRARQLEAIGALEREADALRGEGDTLLSHFPEAERALAEARARDPNAKGPVEVTVGGRTVRIELDETIRGSAQRWFEEARRARGKLEGARAALVETDRKIAGSQVVAAAPKARRGEASSRTPRWFERYRWFLSSERVLVIGGRDAASNDLIVRRYLKATDRYVHAEIHGAPSVIVKHPQPPAPAATETTLEEAGQWGVAFSRAWRAGLASASAFWVEAEQVSKSAASGEFVARGAWVIHGTKHPMKDLPTTLAIGTVTYEGESLWTVAPPRALERIGEPRFYLGPGEERERAEREVELARALEIGRSRLQALLPTGGLTIRRA